MNKSEEAVSVIIPAYNAERSIESCLKSICAQTHENLEILLIDDGSIDKTKEICEKLVHEDERIKYIKKENGGVSSARNRGISESASDYLCFVDADDQIEKDHIENMLCAMQEDVELVFCGFCYKNMTGKTLYKSKIERRTLNRSEAVASALGNKVMQASCCNKLFLRRIIDKNRLVFDEKLNCGEDLKFLLTYILCIRQTVGIPNLSYYYKINPQSETKKQYEKKILNEKLFEEFHLMDCINDLLAANHLDMNKLIKARKASITVSILRNYVMVDRTGSKQYKDYLRVLRKNLRYYLFSDCMRSVFHGISAIMCAVSPKLEFDFYNILRIKKIRNS